MSRLGGRERATKCEVDAKAGTLRLELSNGESVAVPLGVLESSPSGLVDIAGHDANRRHARGRTGAIPLDFARLRLADYGYSVEETGGDFDCGVDTIVMEHDFLFRPETFERDWANIIREMESCEAGRARVREMRERLAKMLPPERGLA